jgi:hypothetical protein
VHKALRRLLPESGPVGEDAGLAVQARYPGLIVYYGEATQSFWATTPTGLLEAHDADALLPALRRCTASTKHVRVPVLT